MPRSGWFASCRSIRRPASRKTEPRSGSPRAAIAKVAAIPADTHGRLDKLAALGHRVIAITAGPPGALQLAGLVAFKME